MSSGAFPSREAQWSRKSRLEKPRGKRRNTKNGAEQCLHGRIGEVQTAGPLPIDLDWIIDPVERIFAQRTILADPLDVQETSVGLKAYPP